MYQDVLLDLSVIFVLVFALFLFKNKKIAWIFLVVAYITPFIREYLNYGLYELPKGYYSYVLTESVIYLLVAIFGLLNTFKSSNLEPCKSANINKLTLGLVGFIIIYGLISLMSYDFIAVNMRGSILLTSLMTVQDILFVYGLILVGLNYRAGLLFLAIGQLILVLPVISFMLQYGDGYYFYFQQTLYVAVNIIIGAVFVRSYAKSLKIKQ